MKIKHITKALLLSFALVSGSFISMETNKVEASTQTIYTKSTTGTVNVREGTSVNSKKIASVDSGLKFKINKTKKTKDAVWHYGEVGKIKGWVNSKNISSKKITVNTLSKKSTLDQKSKVLSYGKKFQGVKYKWGGTSSKGFDCSGFTQYVYKKATGKSIPRTAAAQHKASKKISQKQAVPGDLVFFSAGKGKVTHVAIYAGNGKLLHATSSKGVFLGKINDGYWNKRLIGFGKIA